MKKLPWLLSLMALLIVAPVSSTFAESTVSYDSDASVGFYGEYEYPENPKPEKPVPENPLPEKPSPEGPSSESPSPETPSGSGKSNGTSPAIGGSQSTGGGQPTPSSGLTSEKGTTAAATLPQTGDIANSQTTLIGLLLISSAFILMYKRIQKRI